MAWGDGYLFIGSSAISEENNARGNKIYAIPYDYVSGKAGEPIVVADNLLEPHGVAYRNGTLYFSTSMYVFRIENVITKLGKSIEAEQVLTLPAGDANFPLYPDPVGLYWHQKHTLKFNSFDSNDDNLYISIGSPCNICVIKEEPKYGSILKVDTDTFETAQLAQGIRNTVGFDWDPVLGDLWFTDNNPQNTDGHTTYFPGEINKISAQHLSSGVMPHFGFPYVSGKDTISITPEQENGTAKHTGGYDYIPEGAVYSDILIKDIKPENYQKPEFELEARTAPLGLVFWQPTNTPSNNGERSFVYTTHGPGDGERAGYEVRMLTLSKEGKPLFDRALITGWKQPQGISGKPVELLVMPDNSLLISDDAGNTIYRLEYSPTFSGQINLFPSQGEMDDSAEMIQATLRDSSGTSRRLYMSLSQSGYTIDNLELGDYTLTVPAHGDMKPSQSTISFSLSEHDSIARIDWSYGKDDGNGGNKEGMLSIDSPLQPSNAPSSILLALKSKESEDIYIDSDWASHTEKWVNVGNYTVDFPYTSTAIPTPQRQDIVVSDQGASVSWGYVEYDTDKAYFDAVVGMESSCGACHKGQSSQSPRDFALGPTNGMISAYSNNPDAIAKKIQQMVEWQEIACDSVCQETLARYLEDDLWSDALPNPQQSDIHGRRQLRLMTRQEYANTVRDLFNIDVPLQMLPADDREAEGSLYGNPGKFGYLTSDKMNAYLNTAVYVEENLDIYAVSQCEKGAGEIPEWDSTETYTKLSGNVVHEGNVYKAKYWSVNKPPAQNNAQYGQPWQFVKKYIAADANCLTNWYARILERMIRRPLADEDRLLYPAEDITKQLASLLISPQFLYRREAGVLNQEGRYSLTAHELATLVSYTLVGSLPDVQLWSKANDGSLLTSDVLEQQIDRLLTEPQAYEHFATFMMQTLEFDEERVVVERDGLSKEVGQAMVEEFKAYIRATVFDEELGRFSDLLSHNKTFVNQTLAQHYGLSGNFGSSFSEALIPQNRGTGLLSLGAIAVAYSTDHKTRVIPRGRMVQHSLLGWEQSLPSGKAPDDIKQDTSTKDFWTKATGPSTECWMCHEKMNDIGFAFDVLDKSGRYRAYEDYLSLEGEQYPNVLLQTHGTLVDVDGQDSSFDDLRGLSIYLANSQEARTAFVKNYLSYTLGEASSRFSPLYPEYASFEQFKGLMKTILLSTVVYEREG
ncbi:hypothetical protein GCM10007938_23600 [Vibrio zhanjiangensis]|uniref:Chitin-binding type-3 domain-containing protein n=1 Tax=Vibrio zhanjiangensis TaxID=1046128 RepID=A0ABQ6F0U4_9VIBR|nr:DUF1592 domain-containing protein [Vibrio zhanjiangensis]GLT18581.1 hypothetical protein GCM10007938_23600 [Vibrio zhanjiangensis]